MPKGRGSQKPRKKQASPMSKPGLKGWYRYLHDPEYALTMDMRIERDATQPR